MPGKYKLGLLSSLAALLVMVAELGIKPASFWLLYQPELPKK